MIPVEAISYHTCKFTVNNTSYSGAVTLALKAGNYTITASPTRYVLHSGRITVTYQFVGWSNEEGIIISTSPTITIPLNQDTTLIADYYVTVTGIL